MLQAKPSCSFEKCIEGKPRDPGLGLFEHKKILISPSMNTPIGVLKGWTKIINEKAEVEWFFCFVLFREVNHLTALGLDSLTSKLGLCTRSRMWTQMPSRFWQIIETSEKGGAASYKTIVFVGPMAHLGSASLIENISQNKQTNKNPVTAKLWSPDYTLSNCW